MSKHENGESVRWHSLAQFLCCHKSGGWRWRSFLLLSSFLSSFASIFSLWQFVIKIVSFLFLLFLVSKNSPSRLSSSIVLCLGSQKVNNANRNFFFSLRSQNSRQTEKVFCVWRKFTCEKRKSRHEDSWQFDLLPKTPLIRRYLFVNLSVRLDFPFVLKANILRRTCERWWLESLNKPQMTCLSSPQGKIRKQEDGTEKLH